MDLVALIPHVGTNEKGEDRGTWNEYIDFRDEFPIQIQTKVWYTLALLGKGSDFELYIKGTARTLL